MKRFAVIITDDNPHGISWGPFELDEARAFARKTSNRAVVLCGDEDEANPRIWDYVDPPEEAS